MTLTKTPCTGEDESECKTSQEHCGHKHQSVVETSTMKPGNEIKYKKWNKCAEGESFTKMWRDQLSPRWPTAGPGGLHRPAGREISCVSDIHVSLLLIIIIIIKKKKKSVPSWWRSVWWLCHPRRTEPASPHNLKDREGRRHWLHFKGINIFID